MKNSLPLLIVALSLLAASCEKPPPGAEVRYSFKVQNNSVDSIAFIVSEAYPDTMIPDKESSIKKVAPNIFRWEDQKEKWEDYFAALPKDTLSVFFIDTDTLEQFGFQEIRKKHLVVKRLDIDLNYLEVNNYSVEFP